MLVDIVEEVGGIVFVKPCSDVSPSEKSIGVFTPLACSPSQGIASGNKQTLSAEKGNCQESANQRVIQGIQALKYKQNPKRDLKSE